MTLKSSKTYGRFYAHVHSKAHSPRSREAYLRWVARLGEFYQPEGLGLAALSERQVLDYLIYHCGLRLSEALQLKPTDIDTARGVLRQSDTHSRLKYALK